MEFSELVRREREKRYKTPTDFHRKAELSCTYVAYVGIEKGTSLPKVELAIEIIRKLELSERQALMAWARSQMPDDDSRSVFTEVSGGLGPAYGDFTRPRAPFLSNAQVKLLAAEPLYPEILLYLMARVEGDGLAARDIAKALSVDTRRMTNLLTFLVDYGLSEKDDAGSYRAIGHFNLPDTPEAKQLEAALFESASKRFLATSTPNVTRSCVTRRFSRAQMDDVRSRIANFLASIDALPAAGKDDAVHTVGVFASVRTWSPAT